MARRRAGAADDREVQRGRRSPSPRRRASRRSRAPSSRADGAAPGRGRAASSQSLRRASCRRRRRVSGSPASAGPRAGSRPRRARRSARRRARASASAGRLDADEQRHPDEADEHPDEPAGPCSAGRGRSSTASRAVKSGAEAWMIAARPESSPCSAHEISQNGTAVLNTPTTTSGRPRAAERSADRARAQRERGERQRAETDPAPDQRRGRELPNTDLDEHERGTPDRRKDEQHQQVAATHSRANVQRHPCVRPPRRNRSATDTDTCARARYRSPPPRAGGGSGAIRDARASTN